jgi:hypothetical protein
MSIDTSTTTTTRNGTPLATAARDHLWGHFTRHSVYESTEAGGLGADIPIIVRGKGHRIWDDKGRSYFVSNSRKLRRSRRQSWPTSRCGATRTLRPSSSQSACRAMRPAT